MGTAPPRMLAARAYDVGPDAMAFDVDVQWESELVAEIEMVTKPLGARVPVSVRNVRFEGTVRAVLTPLVAGGPGYGAMLLSLPAPPALKMEVRVVGGEITKVPWLKLELEKYLHYFERYEGHEKSQAFEGELRASTKAKIEAKLGEDGGQTYSEVVYLAEACELACTTGFIQYVRVNRSQAAFARQRPFLCSSDESQLRTLLTRRSRRAARGRSGC